MSEDYYSRLSCGNCNKDLGWYQGSLPSALCRECYNLENEDWRPEEYFARVAARRDMTPEQLRARLRRLVDDVNVRGGHLSFERLRDATRDKAALSEPDLAHLAEGSSVEPLIHEDGSLQQFMPKINGKTFRCECGCNVFHKPDKNDLELYECNSCTLRYLGE